MKNAAIGLPGGGSFFSQIDSVAWAARRHAAP